MKSNTASALKFRKVTAGGQQIDGFVKPADLEDGQEIQGYYRGSPVMGEYQNKVNKIELTSPATLNVWDKEAGKTLPRKFKAGQLIGINTAGMLDKALERVTEGALVQIIYTGMRKIDKGKFKGKESHTFEVGVADSSDAAPTESDSEDSALDDLDNE